MINKIKEYLRKRKAPRVDSDPNYYVLNGDRFWGNSITWLETPNSEEWDSGRITGWTHPRPNEGDILFVSMKSGKVAQYILHNVDYMSDPNDMFFADTYAYEYYKGSLAPDFEGTASQLVNNKSPFAI